jgi:uncharacterized alpha-E superfamily protein
VCRGARACYVRIDGSHHRYTAAWRVTRESDVPQNLDDQVRDCMQRAAECAEQAREVIDPRERADWLVLHNRYLTLARGIQTKRRSEAKIFAA